MPQTPKISIIVPVYNVEKYLPKCLDSIVNQTYKNLEIICVNDESPDNSLKILEEYAKTDNRIKIISQKNQGLFHARISGLKVAKGDICLYLDADDLLADNALQVLHDYFAKHNRIKGKG